MSENMLLLIWMSTALWFLSCRFAIGIGLFKRITSRQQNEEDGAWFLRGTGLFCQEYVVKQQTQKSSTQEWNQDSVAEYDVSSLISVLIFPQVQ